MARLVAGFRQSMSAVFKFPANVEEFFVNFDCDKSDLTITLTCRDGHIPHQEHKPMHVF